MNPLVVIIVAQLLFSTSDFIGRYLMSTSGFSAQSFFSLWFLVYFAIRTIAMFGQLYAFSRIELGPTMALFGVASIVLANVLGLLLLKETLSPLTYIGMTVAIVAFLIIATRT